MAGKTQLLRKVVQSAKRAQARRLPAPPVDENLTRGTFYFRRDQLMALKHKAVSREIDFSAAMREALDAWLTED
jgi:hypothetical protein